MDFNKIFSLLGNENIDKSEIFNLVDLIKNLDLEDEVNIRKVIRKASLIAKKDIPKNVEDLIVSKIQKEGLTSSLFEFI